MRNWTRPLRMLVLTLAFGAIFPALSLAQKGAQVDDAPRGVDLSGDTGRQSVVDRDPNQYLGHPTTVLLEDDRTILCVYPEGHGKGAICLKRSDDAGLTWSERLPTPASWATSKETPTIHRIVAPDGRKGLILFSGLYPIRSAHSDDDGRTWSELTPIGDFGGIVAMSSVERLRDGSYIALFHDDGRFLNGGGKRGPFVVYQTISKDGGLTWGEPRAIASLPDADLCEPGLIRSPCDGAQLAVLLRENSRKHQSYLILSNDEGRTWSEPREVNLALTGDRHVGKYAQDGRLLVTFRDTAAGSPTQGDWVAWAGTYEDMIEGRPGQYRVRLMDNHHQWDCGYPGLERTNDDTFIATSYGHWTEGQPPYVVSVRLRLEELDRIAGSQTTKESP